MTKTIEWYEDAFLEFHLTAGKKAVSASTFPLFKDLKKNCHLKSMINKISDVQPSLSVSPWEMGMKKRNISIISNQGTDSTELFKEYFDLLRIFLKVFLHEDKSPTVTAIKKASQFHLIWVRNCVRPFFLS